MTAGLSSYDIDPAALDPNGIAENQTTGGAADLVLNGALCDLGTAAQFDIADAYSAGIGGIKLLLDSAGDISSVVFTITGLDENGFVQTETVTGVTTTAVSTTKYWSQVTVIAAGAAVASNVFIGTVTGELVSPTTPVNRYSFHPAVGSISGLAGTCQFDLQETFDDLRTEAGNTGATWNNVLSNQSADVAGAATANATGIRLKFDSYSDGAELQFAVAYNPFR